MKGANGVDDLAVMLDTNAGTDETFDEEEEESEDCHVEGMNVEGAEGAEGLEADSPGERVESLILD